MLSYLSFLLLFLTVCCFSFQSSFVCWMLLLKQGFGWYFLQTHPLSLSDRKSYHSRFPQVFRFISGFSVWFHCSTFSLGQSILTIVASKHILSIYSLFCNTCFLTFLPYISLLFLHITLCHLLWSTYWQFPTTLHVF